MTDLKPDCEASSGSRGRYHHGALREALIEAAATELEEAGIEAFSLRRVAKRAGVSHAAPAHHFRDACGLLTALAAEGLRRFVETQRRREAIAGDDASAALVASGLGYIDFAEAHPALFRLIFSSQRPDYSDPALKEASSAAFRHLCGRVEAITGVSPFDDASAMQDAVATWAAAHGLADLLVSGQLLPLAAMEAGDRESVLAGLIQRVLPQPRV